MLTDTSKGIYTRNNWTYQYSTLRCREKKKIVVAVPWLRSESGFHVPGYQSSKFKPQAGQFGQKNNDHFLQIFCNAMYSQQRQEFIGPEEDMQITSAPFKFMFYNFFCLVSALKTFSPVFWRLTIQKPSFYYLRSSEMASEQLLINLKILNPWYQHKKGVEWFDKITKWRSWKWGETVSGNQEVRKKTGNV